MLFTFVFGQGKEPVVIYSNADEEALVAIQHALDENGFQGVDHAHAMVFYDALMKQGVRCTIRKEHGADIDAACGQLRVKHLKKEQEGSRS